MRLLHIEASIHIEASTDWGFYMYWGFAILRLLHIEASTYWGFDILRVRTIETSTTYLRLLHIEDRCSVLVRLSCFTRSCSTDHGAGASSQVRLPAKLCPWYYNKKKKRDSGRAWARSIFFNKIYYSNSLSHIKTASQDYNLKIFAYVRQIKNTIFVFND